MTSYFAGFFDGEGHVSVRQVRYTTGTIGEALQVILTNLERLPLDRAQELWGGRVYKYARPERPKPVFRWHVHSRSAANFLREVFPFLMVKRQQAAFAIELQNRIDANTKRTKRSEIELNERHRLAGAIKALNGRRYIGPPPVLAMDGPGCMSCGCFQPGNDHGDPRNLTLDKFIEAAEVAGITLATCIKNVEETYEGRTVEESLIATPRD